MKKIISFGLILILSLSLVACGKSNEEQGKKYCSNCDEMISESAKFCEHCGCDLSQNTDTVINSDNGDYTFEDYVNDDESSNVENNTPTVSTPDYTQDNKEYKSTCLAVGCDNLPNKNNSYCSEHACAESGCIYEKEYGYSSIYCSHHECNDVLCTNRKKGYGSYCSEHECADPYCTSQKSTLSDYCLIHDD